MLWSHTRVRILLLHKNFCKTENTFSLTECCCCCVQHRPGAPPWSCPGCRHWTACACARSGGGLAQILKIVTFWIEHFSLVVNPSLWRDEVFQIRRLMGSLLKTSCKSFLNPNWQGGSLTPSYEECQNNNNNNNISYETHNLKYNWILRDLTWRKASSVLKLGVFGVTIEIGTGDLNAWNRV